MAFSGIIFLPPRDLTLDRLVREARNAVRAMLGAASSGSLHEPDELPEKGDDVVRPAEVKGHELSVRPFPGTALLEVTVGGPDQGQAKLLEHARSWSEEWKGLVFAWEFDPENEEQSFALYRGGAQVASDDLDESDKIGGRWGRSGIPRAWLQSIFDGIGKPAPGLTVPLDTPTAEVATREPELAALLAALPDTRAQDEQRVGNLVHDAVAVAESGRPVLAAADPLDPRTVSDPAAVDKSNRQVITFLIVSVVLFVALGAFLAFIASRTPPS